MLQIPTVVAILTWVTLRVVFTRQGGQKRAVLAKSCIQTMKQAEARLHRVLIKSDPMPDLNSLVEEQIAPTVDRNIQEDAWPWSGPDPDADSEVEKQLLLLCNKYQGNWASIDPMAPRQGGQDGET